MIKKHADDLIQRLGKVHDEDIDGILADYMKEYAEYGWDSTCEQLANIKAQIDLLINQLKHAAIVGERRPHGGRKKIQYLREVGGDCRRDPSGSKGQGSGMRKKRI